MPTGGLSALLSQVCDDAFRNAPVLRNELVNRTKLSTAIASARTRLLDRMLSAEGEPFPGLAGAPPERTLYLSDRRRGESGERVSVRVDIGGRRHITKKKTPN